MKNRMRSTVIVLFSIFVMNMCVKAKASIDEMMVRSSQTVKFEAQKGDSMSFASHKGRLQKANSEKLDKSKESKSSKAETNTFAMASEFIEAQNAYKLTISDSTGGSLLISDQSLDQAPAEGYTTTAECLLELADKAYDAKKYVYLKTRTGDEAIPYQYSRLELDMTIGKAKLIMDVNAVTNPDGTGNLKYDAKTQRKQIAERQAELQAAIKDKAATDEQIEEMHELEMMQMEDRMANHDRWDFDGNRRRMMQEKRQRQLEADGRIKPKKRTVKQDGEAAPKTK